MSFRPLIGAGLIALAAYHPAFAQGVNLRDAIPIRPEAAYPLGRDRGTAGGEQIGPDDAIMIIQRDPVTGLRRERKVSGTNLSFGAMSPHSIWMNATPSNAPATAVPLPDCSLGPYTYNFSTFQWQCSAGLAVGAVGSVQVHAGGGAFGALGYTPVPDTRQILTSGLLTGGGTLGSDRTISLAAQAACRVLANATTGSAVPTAVALGAGLACSGGTIIATGGGGGGSIQVTNTIDSVSPTTILDFDPTTYDVINAGSGRAQVREKNTVRAIAGTTGTIDATDAKKTIRATNAGAVSVSITPTAAALGPGFWFYFECQSAVICTIDPNGSETFDGSLTLAIGPKGKAYISTDGTGWLAAYLPPTDPLNGANLNAASVTNAKLASDAKVEFILVAISDETTAITTGLAKRTLRMPFAMTLTVVRCNLTTASSAGIPTINIKKGGVSILSTKVTIDVGEETSTTAAIPPVISDSALADDAKMTFDVDVSGTGATGLKCMLSGPRS